ncbi:MAG TPA: 4Fe-4S dicluster domain-containing protein, partial [Candidatus Sulfotelmatobacter sp.]|nr:4Fe-4S dicluster domain-containing protein [Candidatus Sulfotelmatobacter sp.]
MPDLVPAPLSTLLKRAYHEPGRQETLFDLPLKDFYRGTQGVDTAVSFHGLPAGTPLGPAAGPHDQLAQNIVLAWLGGSRIIELKTVQVLDELTVNRPCIDMTNIGFNIEWSQELKLQQALREYVKASMIIEILRAENALGIQDPAALPSHFYDVVYDLSVGYDLKGIQSDAVTGFIQAARHAGAVVDELRGEIPDEYARYRDHAFRTDLVKTATLSTFHGCPKDEIERICRYLIEEMGLHTIVKLNPVQIGKEKLEEILYAKLGYTHLQVNQKAYQTGLSLHEAFELVQRLEPAATKRGLDIGVKFSNTLEVHNTLGRMPDEVMYLSGQPLHVIAVALVEEWRALAGTRFPVSFAAGVDRRNFADAVAMGLVPVTVCTDLLRPRGYGRQLGYLTELATAMKKVGAATVDEYVLRARAAGTGELEQAILHNTEVIARETLSDPRYSWAQNSKEPNKIDSHLFTFDCISCDKCLPVCPNDANFVFETEPVRFQYRDYRLSRGALHPDESRWFAIEQRHQLANFADFCNECGNCDTFCPEYGGPFIEKPGFFADRGAYEGRPGHDGFFVERSGGTDR